MVLLVDDTKMDNNFESQEEVQKNSNAQHQGNNFSGNAITLDEYFNSQKEYSASTMIEKNENFFEKKNAMIMEKIEQSPTYVSDENNLSEDDEKEIEECCSTAQDSEKSTHDDCYEDDYESDTSDKKTPLDESIKGMSLGDYFSSKDDYNEHNMKNKSAVLKAQEEKKNGQKEKQAVENNVKGMSLEAYLGASNNNLAHEGDKKVKKVKAKPKHIKMHSSNIEDHHFNKNNFDKEIIDSKLKKIKRKQLKGASKDYNKIVMNLMDSKYGNIDKRILKKKGKKAKNKKFSKEESSPTKPLPTLCNSKIGIMNESSLTLDSSESNSRLPPL